MLVTLAIPAMPVNTRSRIALLCNRLRPRSCRPSRRTDHGGLNHHPLRVAVECLEQRVVLSATSVDLASIAQTVAGMISGMSGVAVPAPGLIDLTADTDSGRSNSDNITRFDANPATGPTVLDAAVFDIQLDITTSPDFADLNLVADNVADDAPSIARADTEPIDYGVELFNHTTSIGFAHHLGGDAWRFVAGPGDLSEGDVNSITAAVWYRESPGMPVTGHGPSSPALQITLDTQSPAAPAIRLLPDEDTGVPNQAETYLDRVTSELRPEFGGTAEVDALIRVWVDGVNFDNRLDPLNTDAFWGSTVVDSSHSATPSNPNAWQLQGQHELNYPIMFPYRDGQRQLAATAEDLAGNISNAGFFDLLLDTQGPQVSHITLAGHPNDTPFDPFASPEGPTPLADRLQIAFTDGPDRGTDNLNRASAPFVDVVFVVDESVSMDGEHLFLQSFVPVFEQSLLDAGLGAGETGGNRYGLVGFGSGLGGNQGPQNLGRSLLIGDELFGSPDEFADAAQFLLTLGSFEDGYSGIDYALSQYNLRDDAGKLFILVSDEDRDVADVGLDFTDIQSALTVADVTLHGILSVELRDQQAQRALAIDANGTAFLPDGTGNFVTGTGGIAVAGSGQTVADYAQLVLDRDGLVADLAQLRQGGIAAQSFSAAILHGWVTSVSNRFTYPAVNRTTAINPAHYRLVGQEHGEIAIESIEFVDSSSIDEPGLTRLLLQFATPLPDDDYTFTILQNVLRDNAGNLLDGETPGTTGQTSAWLPSGDGQPGGGFSVSFTMDSRPEIAAVSQGAVNLDINGNGLSDPSNTTGTRDLVFPFGLPSDSVFAGQFHRLSTGVASGYDTLAAYGINGGTYRWLIDFDGDGIPEHNVVSGLQLAGTPIAGNFDLMLTGIDSHPGDEIGLFDGSQWYFDTNGNGNIDAGDAVLPAIGAGVPVVGDFDGDGRDDLGIHISNATENRFYIDLAFDGIDGATDGTLELGIGGVTERPIAADLNLDGVDDLGVAFANPNTSEDLEWRILMSTAGPTPGTLGALNHSFATAPSGSDIFMTFGSRGSAPIVGNFRPLQVTPQPMHVPTLASPVQEFTQTLWPTFHWSAVPGADHYDIWVNDLTTGQMAVIRDQSVSTNSYTPQTPLQNGHSYIWTVRAAASPTAVPGDWATHAVFSLNVSSGLGTQRPKLITPIDGTLSLRPTFVWTSVLNAARYDLWVNDLTTGQNAIVRKTDVIGTAHQPLVDLPAGHEFIWTVRAIGVDNMSGEWAAHQTFATIELGTPQLLEPLGVTPSSTPLFRWSAVNGADHYEIWVNDLSTGQNGIIRQSTILGTSAAFALQSGHNYLWTVRAISLTGGLSAWASHQSFTIAGLSHELTSDDLPQDMETETETAASRGHAVLMTEMRLHPSLSRSVNIRATIDLSDESLVTGTTRAHRKQHASVSTSRRARTTTPTAHQNIDAVMSDSATHDWWNSLLDGVSTVPSPTRLEHDHGDFAITREMTNSSAAVESS